MASIAFCPATVNNTPAAPTKFDWPKPPLDRGLDPEGLEAARSPTIALMPVESPGGSVQANELDVIAERMFIVQNMLEDQPGLDDIRRIGRDASELPGGA